MLAYEAELATQEAAAAAAAAAADELRQSGGGGAAAAEVVAECGGAEDVTAKEGVVVERRKSSGAVSQGALLAARPKPPGRKSSGADKAAESLQSAATAASDAVASAASLLGLSPRADTAEGIATESKGTDEKDGEKDDAKKNAALVAAAASKAVEAAAAAAESADGSELKATLEAVMADALPLLSAQLDTQVRLVEPVTFPEGCRLEDASVKPHVAVGRRVTVVRELGKPPEAGTVEVLDPSDSTIKVRWANTSQGTNWIRIDQVVLREGTPLGSALDDLGTVPPPSRALGDPLARGDDDADAEKAEAKAEADKKAALAAAPAEGEAEIKEDVGGGAPAAEGSHGAGVSDA